VNPFVNVFLMEWTVFFQTVLKGDEHWLPICDGGGEKSGPETTCEYYYRLHLRKKRINKPSISALTNMS